MTRPRKVRLFHYKTEKLGQRTIEKLRRIHPTHTFEFRMREDWRFYIWAETPGGHGGWVQRISRSEMQALLPTDSNKKD